MIKRSESDLLVYPLTALNFVVHSAVEDFPDAWTPLADYASEITGMNASFILSGRNPADGQNTVFL